MNLELFESQAGLVRRYAMAIPGCDIPVATPQRIVVRCVDRPAARQLAFRLNDAGFAVAMQPGRRSVKHYVRVFLNKDQPLI